jgi:hypothetical protein
MRLSYAFKCIVHLFYCTLYSDTFNIICFTVVYNYLAVKLVTFLVSSDNNVAYNNTKEA